MVTQQTYTAILLRLRPDDFIPRTGRGKVPFDLGSVSSGPPKNVYPTTPLQLVQIFVLKNRKFVQYLSLKVEKSFIGSHLGLSHFFDVKRALYFQNKLQLLQNLS